MTLHQLIADKQGTLLEATQLCFEVPPHTCLRVPNDTMVKGFPRQVYFNTRLCDPIQLSHWVKEYPQYYFDSFHYEEKERHSWAYCSVPHECHQVVSLAYCLHTLNAAEELEQGFVQKLADLFNEPYDHWKDTMQRPEFQHLRRIVNQELAARERAAGAVFLQNCLREGINPDDVF